MTINSLSPGQVTVLFHSNSVTARGTEVALFDYAEFNEEILGNRSVVAFPVEGVESEAIKEKFESRFKTQIYTSQEQLEDFAQATGATVCYMIKNGKNDGVAVKGIKNVVHSVFKNCDPHGDVYAYISKWLSQEASAGRYDYVPHIIRPPLNTAEMMRTALGIPEAGHVYGAIGGTDSFKSLRATNAILDTIAQDPNKYFVFVKTRLPEWLPWTKARINRAIQAGRLIYIDEISDLNTKEKFINSCDALLHARRRGETFGIALGEFSVRGKPVIVQFRAKAKDRCHYDILGDTANYFTSRAEMRTLLSQDPQTLRVSPNYSQFAPDQVMSRFEAIFLSNTPKLS